MNRNTRKKIKTSVLTKIKSQDMYGHPVKLNFAESGDSHKTMIGGLFSLIINFLIWTFIAYNIKKLLLMEANKDTLHNRSIDLEEFGNVNYTETNFTLFSVLQK